LVLFENIWEILVLLRFIILIFFVIEKIPGAAVGALGLILSVGDAVGAIL
jgi:hypothetical protein